MSDVSDADCDGAAKIQTWLEAAAEYDDDMLIEADLLRCNHPIAAAYRLSQQLPESVARGLIIAIELATPDDDQAVVGLALSCVTTPYGLVSVTAPDCRLRSGYAFSGYSDYNALVAKSRAATDEAVQAAVARFDEADQFDDIAVTRFDGTTITPSLDDDKFRSVLRCAVRPHSRMVRMTCRQVASGAISPEIALLFIMYAYRTREAGTIGALPEECRPAAVAAVLAAAFERQRQPPVLVLPQVIV